MPTAFQNWLIANNKPGVADMTPGMYSTYSNQFQDQDKAELPTIDISNQVMKAGMIPDLSNINWSGILEGGKNLFGFGNNEPPTGINRPILDAYQRSPHRGFGDVTTPPYMFQDMTVDEERIPGRIQEEGVTKQGFQFPSVLGGIINAVKDQFEYRPAETEAWDPNTGKYISAEEQDKQNALGGWYSDAARDARRKRARVVKMIARRDAGKSFSEKNLKRLQDLGYGPEEIISQVTDVVQPGTGTTYTGPQTYDYSPSQAARTEHYTERPGTQGGFIDPGKGSYGPWKAEGGRVGYRDGEFVDEDVNIAGPGFDVNEQMAGFIDPQDALNDMSMNVFGKPLHDLSEDEYQILIDMANDQAMNEQGEGIASLV